jgi:hypothetical protein
MKKIIKRGMFFLFMGIAALFFIELVINWEETVNIIKQGYNDGYEAGYEF